MNYSKDGVTVAAMFDSAHPKKSGKCSVKIRVTYNRVRHYYPTGKDLMPAEWDALPTTKARALVEIRKDIESSYQIVRAAVEDLLMRGIFSLENLNNRLKRAGGDTLNIAFEGKIAEMKAQERIGNMMAYRVVMKGIERFAGPRVPLSGVSVDWIRRYEKFLLKEGKNRTTVGIHMRHIRAILNDMKRCGKISEAQYPFGRGRYEIQAGEGRKLALTLEQIGQIANYEDGTEATAKYRDYWLFLYLCNGGKSSVSCPLKPKRFSPLKTFNNAPLKSLDRWGYYYFSLFPTVCSHFTDTFSCQLNPVRRMYNTIHNGICYCRVSDCIIPIVRWQLRGDDDGLAPMSVLYYIEQDGSFLGIKVHKEEVIQYEQRAPFDSLEFRFQCAFYFCHLKRTHKFRSIRIICPYALLAGFIPHCCGKEALPGTG